MAGGPLQYYSAFPVDSGKTFPWVLDSEEGLGVMASVDADCDWRQLFLMPGTLPSGTAKLVTILRANATTGNTRLNIAWASYATAQAAAWGSLNAEGVQTIAVPGTALQFTITKTTLDADTVVGGEIIALELGFETTSWTLAVKSLWQDFIVWED